MSKSIGKRPNLEVRSSVAGALPVSDVACFRLEKRSGSGRREAEKERGWGSDRREGVKRKKRRRTHAVADLLKQRSKRGRKNEGEGSARCLCGLERSC